MSTDKFYDTQHLGCKLSCTGTSSKIHIKLVMNNLGKDYMQVIHINQNNHSNNFCNSSRLRSPSPRSNSKPNLKHLAADLWYPETTVGNITARVQD